jgi:transcriptional regulator GlxA family with amidase domain
MTKEVYFLPMPRHRIFILAYEGCQLLDVTGPAAVFGAANESRGQPFYDLGIVSPDGGAVASNSGVAIQSRKIGGQPDTLLVAGGSRGLKAAMARDDLRRWLRAVTPKARRFGSVCTGAFVLAAAGLLDGKRVATHWSSCERLARQFPTLGSTPIRSTSSTAGSGRRPASRPASTWRWPSSRPTSARPPRT